MNKNIIIRKKENNEALTFEELNYFFNGYLNGLINDDDMTLLLKAICLNGMSDEEVFDLVDIFIKSGDVMNLDDINIKDKNIEIVDKHSTGGVGDKTTLIVAPIVASCHCYLAKMSGRALGYTGGTIDKLESIPNFRVNLDEEEFKKEVEKIGFAITSQTKDIAPMDKKVYALRDVTNTTKSIALIATSIMSKKIASGAKKILIDIKVGKGALVSDIFEARSLARLMIAIGAKYKKEVRCMLTRMDNPLGDNIGNSLEILEVLDILQNKKNNNLSYLTKQMASILISMSKNIDYDKALKEVEEVLQNKKAYHKFLEFINFQKGDITKLKLSKGKEIKSLKTGYVKEIDAKSIGLISMKLGAGRVKKDDKIDYNAGIIINKNLGDYVKKGDVLVTIYGKNDIDINDIYNAYKFSYLKPKQKNIIIDIIG